MDTKVDRGVGQSPLPGAWVSLSLLLAINLLNYIDRQVLAAVEPRIRETFNISKTTSGWLGTAFIVSYMLTAPLFGWMADRKSRWFLVGFGVLLWSGATAASGWAGTFTFLLISRLFVGVGEAGYGPAAPTIISDLFPIRWRGRVIAGFYIAMPVGAALGYIIGDKLGGNPHWGWRSAFYVVTIPGILLGIVCFFFKDPPRGTVDAGHAIKGLPSREDYLHILRIPSYIVNTLAMAAMSFAIGGMSYWMTDYLEYRKVGPGSGSTFGIIIASAGLTATVLGGVAGDMVRKVYGGAYFLVSGIGITLAAPMVIAMLYVPFPTAWWFLFGAIFFLFFNTGPANTALANVVNPKLRASAFALNIFLIHAMGDVPAPPIIGHIVGAQNHWNSAFYLVAGFMVLAGVLWLYGATHLKADEDAAIRSESESHGESAAVRAQKPV
jgi:MFS family permease